MRSDRADRSDKRLTRRGAGRNQPSPDSAAGRKEGGQAIDSEEVRTYAAAAAAAS